MLSSRQRSHLKSLAHDKKPIVMLGHKGLTEAVVNEASQALLAHELIKVKLASDDTLDEVAANLAERTEALLVVRIGKVAVLYKAHPDTPRIHLPRPARTKMGLGDVVLDDADDDNDDENDDA